MPSIDELVMAGPAEAWRAAGFRVEDGVARVGSVRIRFDGVGATGLVGWSLRDAASAELDGLATELSPRPPAEPDEHPNGACAVDHVVVLTDELERTAAAFERAGCELRRVRDAGGGVRQGFFRLGEVIAEAVETADAPGPGASFWGIVFVVGDLERAAALLGDGLGTVRDAVQPGRRIAPIRDAAGLGLPVALMTAAPAR